MNEEKHIAYSAADIERYHKGLMTAKEKHALEKAALDDPFLADAIEGYGSIATNTDDDIALLNHKLDERIGKVVPMKKKGFAWLRVAALFILITGAGLLAYKYILSGRKADVAKIEQKDTVTKSDAAATIAPPAATVTDSVATTESKSPGAEATAQQKTVAKHKESEKQLPAGNKDARILKQVNDDEALEKTAQAPARQNAYDIAANTKNDVKKIADSVQYNFQVESTATNAGNKNSNDLGYLKGKNAQPQTKAYALKESAAARGVVAQNNQTRFFHGQVTDQYNSPLPFANVTIVPDNVGTYTDAKGNFTLISADSTLNVQVRSVGFENKTSTLQNAVANNAIVMEQDTKNVPSTVISNRNINSERKRTDNMKLEEPEPADGWYNYDTYIANNIKMSDEIKMKTSSASEVELSFDVNEFGEPVNIKVEKSVCKECDAEAVRLLKDGPKWRKNKKNRRAKVSVTFR